MSVRIQCPLLSRHTLLFRALGKIRALHGYLSPPPLMCRGAPNYTKSSSDQPFETKAPALNIDYTNPRHLSPNPYDSYTFVDTKTEHELRNDHKWRPAI